MMAPIQFRDIPLTSLIKKKYMLSLKIKKRL